MNELSDRITELENRLSLMERQVFRLQSDMINLKAQFGFFSPEEKYVTQPIIHYTGPGPRPEDVRWIPRGVGSTQKEG